MTSYSSLNLIAVIPERLAKNNPGFNKKTIEFMGAPILGFHFFSLRMPRIAHPACVAAG
jgi:hypothetical protein